jgi:hypothetical protein
MEEKIQENQKLLYSTETKNSEVLHTIESLADGIKVTEYLFNPRFSMILQRLMDAKPIFTFVYFFI